MLATMWASRAQADTYREVRQQVDAEMTEMQSLNKSIQQLAVEKDETTDPDKKAEILSKMLKAHQHLRAVYKSYSNDLDRLRYEFPDNGDHSRDRLPASFSHFKLRSLQDIEKGSDLDKELDQAKHQLIETYGLKHKNKNKLHGKGHGGGVKPDLNRPKLVE